MKAALATLFLAAGASAHTIFSEVYVNGQGQGIGTGLRMPSYNGPIEDVTSSAMACNGGPNPLTQISNKKISVKAGDQIGLKWIHTTGSVIDASHKGPIMVYMNKVSDSVTASAPSSGWFKIYEDGLSGGRWAVDKLIANNGIVTVTIPSCLAPGDYLFRGELIALHSAGNYPGAQFYMECAQFTVTSGGSTVPSSTVSFPGAYSGSDPGVRYNLYSGQTSYTIPGPRPMSCSGGGGGNQQTTTQQQQQPTTTRTTQQQQTTTRTTQQQQPTTTQNNGGGGSNCASKYAQCGGNGYSGATCCASGSTCKFSNDWYSQCL